MPKTPTHLYKYINYEYFVNPHTYNLFYLDNKLGLYDQKHLSRRGFHRKRYNFLHYTKVPSIL